MPKSHVKHCSFGEHIRITAKRGKADEILYYQDAMKSLMVIDW